MRSVNSKFVADVPLLTSQLNLSAVCSAMVLTSVMDSSVSSGAGVQSVALLPF